MSESQIYFIRCKEAVKVGRTQNVNVRLQTLQIGNHQKLELLYQFPEELFKEDKIHKGLIAKGKRIRNEWFIYDDYMKDLISLFKIFKNQRDENTKKEIFEKLNIIDEVVEESSMMNLRVDPELHQFFKKYCKENGKLIHFEAKKALLSYIEREGGAA